METENTQATQETPVMTNTELLSILGDFVGGQDTQLAIRAKQDAMGGYVSIPTGQSVEVIPLTNLLQTETLAELTQEQRDALQNRDDLDAYVGALQESLQKTAFFSNTVSLFFDKSDVEKHNASLPEGSPDRLGGALKFRMSSEFSARQAERFANADPVAWLVHNHEQLRTDNAFSVRLQYNFGTNITNSKRAFLIVRNTDGAEQLLEMSENQLAELRPVIEAVTGFGERKWRGGRWLIGKANKKFTAKYLGNAEPENEDDDFYPSFISMTHRGFGVATGDIKTRATLIARILKPEYLANLPVKPKWYTENIDIDFD